MTKNRAIIVDLDGCLADHSHRLHHVELKDPEGLYEMKLFQKKIKANVGNIWHEWVHRETGKIWEKDWDSFFAGMGDDKCNEWCQELIERFSMESYSQLGVSILFVTGRPEKYRNKTTRWLDKYISGYGMKLFMRPDFINVPAPCPNYKFYNGNIALGCMSVADHRPAHEVKREIYEGEIAGKYDVLFAIDDDEKCCEIYKKLGIVTLKVM